MERYRPLDRLRMLEQALENTELMATLADLKDQFTAVAMLANEPELREAARLKFLAVEDVIAAIRSRMADRRGEVEAEMAAERERGNA